MNHHAIGYVVLVCSSLLRSSEEVYVVYDTGCNERKSVVCFLYLGSKASMTKKCKLRLKVHARGTAFCICENNEHFLKAWMTSSVTKHH